MELPAPDGSWRADVMATSTTHGRQTAWEAQLSPITGADIQMRTDRYADDGIDVCWVSSRDRVLWLCAVPAIAVTPANPPTAGDRWMVPAQRREQERQQQEQTRQEEAARRERDRREQAAAQQWWDELSTTQLTELLARIAVLCMSEHAYGIALYAGHRLYGVARPCPYSLGRLSDSTRIFVRNAREKALVTATGLINADLVTHFDPPDYEQTVLL
ncbi:hypothetical protein [Nonomuraea sp. NPDC003709]|uniref:competence protein CoiA family protein n=1 Tax=Nonomuraea sp. NPDC003709 TaxID=3154450 RepID=UPI0033A6C30E